MDLITIKNFKDIAPTIGGTGAQIPVDSLADVSDGYHTIEELYDHRITLYIALCRVLMSIDEDDRFPCQHVWRSKIHGDGSVMEGWFVLGIGKENGKQVTYHLPNSRWDETSFAETLDKAPEWDGHTSKDVLERLKGL